MRNEVPIHLLLADDDSDDRFMFAEALNELPINTSLDTVCDGQRLMDHLNNNLDKLPDLLFIDLNMPRKKGCECLVEIKSNAKLKHIPVIIYTSEGRVSRSVQGLSGFRTFSIHFSEKEKHDH